MSQSLIRWTKRILLSGLLLVFALFCLLLGTVAFAQSASSQMAYSLVPPEYPQSRLEEQWQSGGTTTMWDRRTYHAAASVDEVLAFYETHFSGFTPLEESVFDIQYTNSKCDESWLARQIARFINERHYPWRTADDILLPCLSISIYPAPDDSAETEYTLWIDWPAS